MPNGRTRKFVFGKGPKDYTDPQTCLNTTRMDKRRDKVDALTEHYRLENERERSPCPSCGTLVKPVLMGQHDRVYHQRLYHPPHLRDKVYTSQHKPAIVPESVSAKPVITTKTSRARQRFIYKNESYSLTELSVVLNMSYATAYRHLVKLNKTVAEMLATIDRTKVGRHYVRKAA